MAWFLVWLVSIIATATLAGRKGRSSGGWGLLAVLLGPLALLLVLVVSPIREEQERAAVATGDSKKCPFCAEVVKTEAIVCRYCGRDLPKIAVSTAGALGNAEAATGVAATPPPSTWKDNPLIVIPLIMLVCSVLYFGYESYQEHKTPSSSTPSALDHTAPPLNPTPTPEEKAAAEKYRAEDEAAMQRAKEMANAWNYSSDTDDISGRQVKFATVTSSNQVEFDSPYQGPQHAQLQIRQHPRWGLDAILTIERGQIMCDLDGCPIHVLFDDGAATSFTGARPADNSSTVLFLKPASRLVARLKKSKRMVIEATFFQEGSRTFVFDVHGLEWTDAKAARPSSVASARDAAQSRCDKGATYVERMPCLDSVSECFRKFPDSDASNRPRLIACLNEVHP